MYCNMMIINFPLQVRIKMNITVEEMFRVMSNGVPNSLVYIAAVNTQLVNYY